jgi:4-aminobutyrate aminotransferase-like enzyme
MNNAFNPEAAQGLDPHSRELVERRARLLGPAYRLFYQRPVHIVRGSGCRLWDADGHEYLDAYNNVVSVGHCNPSVVQAVERQMRELCTHTRYLHDGILDYAERLLATFDDGLANGHVMLTCTGSEANDLALRIAKYRTGHDGVIITAEAYHGNSEQTAGVSPSLGDNSPLGKWIRCVPAPDSYRNDSSGLAEQFAAWVDKAIADLERQGNGVAALLVDSAFTSDGIFVEPTELLGPAAERVRAAGGLLIADEVQCGFGRMGSSLWGHQRHRVVPDIATLGKPMGNGYPVAGLAVRAEVVADFGHDIRYFNTFGGNTVAVAAADATLGVIENEDLVARSLATGSELVAGMRELEARHQCIGDVRGSGLYVGIEIVADRETKAPDGGKAATIVNGLCERRVLISATGRYGNVLKIRPPLVFDSGDADRLLTELDAVLAETAAGA